MDKRKVITAYRRGLLSVHECAQIIGLDSARMLRMMVETEPIVPHKRVVRS